MATYDLCVITRRVERLNRTHLDVARAALDGGATMIQLREKALSDDALLQLAAELCALTRARGAAFIINDRVDIALASNADGVHLGEDDLPIAVARRLLGPGAIIGATATDPRRAEQAEQDGASYLGVGPIFPTPSKPDAGAPIGFASLTEISRTVSIPVLAIGGIACENVARVIAAGADGIAVISAVAEAENMAAAAAALRRCVEEARKAHRGKEQSA